MNKIILIINLIVKTIVEILIATTIMAVVGLLFFIGTFIYKSIVKAVDDYYEAINID